jgi:hypothetical protein
MLDLNKLPPSVLMQAVPIVAQSIAEDIGVRVVWGHNAKTDGEVIYLPYIDLTQEFYANIIFGYMAHEASHVVNTDFNVYRPFARKSPVHGAVLNIVEDIYIEKEIMTLYPYVREHLEKTIMEVDSKGGFTAKEGDVVGIFQWYLLSKMRNDTLKQPLTGTVENNEKLFEKTFPESFKIKVDSLMSKAHLLQNTNDSVDLASILLKMIEEESQDPEDEDSQDDSESSNESSDEKGESSDSDESSDDKGESSDSDESSDEKGKGSASDDKSDDEDESSDSDDKSDDEGEGSDSDDKSDDEGESSDSDDKSDDEGESSDSDDKSDDEGESSDSDDKSDDEGEGSNSDDKSDDEDESSDSDDKSDDEGESSDSDDTDQSNTSKGAGNSSNANNEEEQAKRDALKQLMEASSEDVKEGTFEQLKEAIQREFKVNPQEYLMPFNCRPVNYNGHDQSDDVRSTSNAIATQIRMLIESKNKTRRRKTYAGKKFNSGRLANIRQGNFNIFDTKTVQSDMNTAISMLIDSSSSMNASQMALAQQAALAFSMSLDYIDGVVNEVQHFPCQFGNGIMKSFDENLVPVAKNFSFRSAGGTPMAEALLGSALRLFARNEERKIMLVLTDGEPSNAKRTLQSIQQIEEMGIEVIALGIQYSGVTKYFDNYQIINSMDELQPAIFSILRNSFQV